MSGNYERPNPLLTALTKAGTAVAALGGVVSYLVTAGLITLAQGDALTAAAAQAQDVVAHLGGVVAGVLAILAGLSTAFGTVQVGKQGTTPVVDARDNDGVQLVRADGAPIAPVIDPSAPAAPVAPTTETGV